MKSYNFKTQPRAEYRTLPGMITYQLREAILSGELGGGFQLKQEELASKFNVSMSALREALKSLEAEGLVRFYPNRGAIVTELSSAEAEEIFDIRLYLELGALELAIPKLTQEHLAAAESVLQQADNDAEQQWGILNWRFHETLYKASDRPKLLDMIRMMHNNIQRYMRIYLSALHYQEKSQSEHWQLLKHCANGDVIEAKKMLRTHMADAKKSLSSYLNQ